MTMFESFTTEFTFATPTLTPVDTIWGPEDDVKAVDDVSLFETEMYVSRMHGGHGGVMTVSCIAFACYRVPFLTRHSAP